MVSSIENRVRTADRSATRSDLRTRASSRSSVVELVVGAGDGARAREVESACEHRAALRSAFSASSSRSYDHCTAWRSVWWRSSPRRDPTSSRNRSSSRSRTSVTVIDNIRDAANSIASGIPSRRRQISTTAPALSSALKAISGATCWLARRTTSPPPNRLLRSRRAPAPARVVRRPPPDPRGLWRGRAPSTSAR